MVKHISYNENLSIRMELNPDMGRHRHRYSIIIQHTGFYAYESDKNQSANVQGSDRLGISYWQNLTTFRLYLSHFRIARRMLQS